VIFLWHSRKIRVEMGSGAVLMSTIPRWIQEAAARNDSNTAAWIAENSLKFFGELLSECEVNVQYLFKVGAHGRVSPLSKIGESEQRFRVDVLTKSQINKITYTDVSYRPGKIAVIGSITMDGERDQYRLCDLGGEIGVIVDSDFSQLSAKRLAERIVRDAFERIAPAS
jgi:hypothetical protein